MESSTVLAVVAAAIPTAQLLIATWCAGFTDRIGKSSLDKHLQEIQKDTYGIRVFFEDTELGEVRKGDILILSRDGGTAAATLAAMLGIVVAAVLTTVAAALTPHKDDIVVAGVVLSVLSAVSLVGMLLAAGRGPLRAYRVGAEQGSGIRKFVNSRWWNTVTLYRDVGFLLGVSVIVVIAWLPL